MDAIATVTAWFQHGSAQIVVNTTVRQQHATLSHIAAFAKLPSAIKCRQEQRIRRRSCDCKTNVDVWRNHGSVPPAAGGRIGEPKRSSGAQFTRADDYIERVASGRVHPQPRKYLTGEYTGKHI
jgi:hypothetical protein